MVLLIVTKSDEDDNSAVVAVVSSSTEGNVATEDIAFIVYIWILNDRRLVVHALNTVKIQGVVLDSASQREAKRGQSTNRKGEMSRATP